MDGKAFTGFISDLETHHGRRFNEKSFQLLADRIRKIPTEAITDHAIITLKAGYNTIPAPLAVVVLLEAEGAKVRIKKAEAAERSWERVKEEERGVVASMLDEDQENFRSRSFRFMLLLASGAPEAYKLREFEDMTANYPEIYPPEEFLQRYTEAENRGEVARCQKTDKITGPEECRLYRACQGANL